MAFIVLSRQVVSGPPFLIWFELGGYVWIITWLFLTSILYRRELFGMRAGNCWEWCLRGWGVRLLDSDFVQNCQTWISWYSAFLEGGHPQGWFCFVSMALLSLLFGQQSFKDVLTISCAEAFSGSLTVCNGLFIPIPWFSASKLWQKKHVFPSP